MMKIQVIREDGQNLTYKTVLMRETVGRFISASTTFVLLFGYLLAVFHPKKKALHDMIAGTNVIYRQSPTHPNPQ